MGAKEQYLSDKLKKLQSEPEVWITYRARRHRVTKPVISTNQPKCENHEKNKQGRQRCPDCGVWYSHEDMKFMQNMGNIRISI